MKLAAKPPGPAACAVGGATKPPYSSVSATNMIRACEYRFSMVVSLAVRLALDGVMSF
jgi:hypothetical protein